jgi:hypothetical protein
LRDRAQPSTGCDASPVQACLYRGNRESDQRGDFSGRSLFDITQDQDAAVELREIHQGLFDRGAELEVGDESLGVIEGGGIRAALERFAAVLQPGGLAHVTTTVGSSDRVDPGRKRGVSPKRTNVAHDAEIRLL